MFVGGLCLLLVFGVCAVESLVQTKYIDYYPGTLNVILSAPHGGNLVPEDIPNRDYGCYIKDDCVWTHNCGTKDTKKCKATTVTDSYTWKLTLDLREALYTKFNKYPYAVINKLKRTKMDANRERGQASFNVTSAAQAWDEYHGFIDQAKAEVEKHGPGILFDIHGHGRKQQWAMMGVLIRGTELQEGSFTADQTSIKAMIEREGVEHLDAIVRGSASFGAYLMAEGFDAVPSPTYPDPDGATFYSGGYITRRHGSRDGGDIDVIQIESPREFRTSRYEDYVEALATAIQGYLTRYYPVAMREEVRDTDKPGSTATAHCCNTYCVLITLMSLILTKLL